MSAVPSSVVVSGGASGLGAACVRHFRAQGRGVVFVDPAEERGALVATETGAVQIVGDVTSEADVAEAVAKAEAMAPLRVAVCCAGVGWAARVVQKDGSPHPLDLFEKVVSINLVGTFNVARHAAAAMASHDPQKGGDRGVVVMTASIAGYEGQKGQAAYAASKAGVIGLVLPMARDLATRGVRVVGVAPGTFSTPMLHGLTPAQVEGLAAGVPHPARLGEPAEFATFVQQIVDTPYLNGEVVRLDGALRLG